MPLSREQYEALGLVTTQLWTMTQQHFDPDVVEVANEAAIELIANAGFDAQDSDQLGSEMSDHVQTLLAMAILRCPELADIDPSEGN